MKRASAAAVLLAALALSACGERVELKAIPAGAQKQLSIALPGPLSALYGPLFAAQASGDLARGELALTPTASSSGPAALERLASGEVDVAVASEPELLAARERGDRLVSIGALTQGPLEALLSIAPRTIGTVAQLRGQTVAVSGQPLQGAELDTMLTAARVDPSTVRRLPAGSDPTSALGPKAAAALGYWNYDAVALEQHHRRPTAIGVQSAGVPAFTQLALVVRVAEARHEGPILRGLLQALMRGTAQLRVNPQPALAALLAASSGLDSRFELAVLQRTLLLPSSASLPFGYQDPHTWGAFGDWMQTHHLLAKPAHAELALTNEFLPGQGE
ncbi:MAG: ABC transporter substrate-binding protein [Solirubrobacteraceae bacterium]